MKEVFREISVSTHRFDYASLSKSMNRCCTRVRLIVCIKKKQYLCNVAGVSFDRDYARAGNSLICICKLKSGGWIRSCSLLASCRLLFRRPRKTPRLGNVKARLHARRTWTVRGCVSWKLWSRLLSAFVLFSSVFLQRFVSHDFSPRMRTKSTDVEILVYRVDGSFLHFVTQY